MNRLLKPLTLAAAFALLACISLPAAATAGPNDIVGTPTVETTSHFGTSAQAEINGSTAAHFSDKLSANFATLGNSQITATITSPTGRFYANFVTAGHLQFDLKTGDNFKSSGFINPSIHSITFNNVIGNTPGGGPADRFLTGPGGDFFRVGSVHSVSAGSFSFESITYILNVPASYNVDFSNPNFTNASLRVTGLITSATPLGQFVSINPIPEPASLSLLAFGALAITRRRK
ncbi:PEP-CTERM sorting domain-containing protein [Poriferisphaera sp. WC338]|uniref:PEP-CTERM sorting domain-containing protein n=1 Tax=Poriferisphaera sp. WC338 TaxID=3425129 RepID=UPI003D8166EE